MKTSVIQCKCGCGEQRLEYDRWGDKHQFIAGHQNKGSTNGQWKGGIKKTHGYIKIKIPSHHFADTNGYVFQHRLVWELHNKASLLPWGDIHHLNDTRDDNRIENLEAMMDWQHSAIEWEKRKQKMLFKLKQIRNIRRFMIDCFEREK